jgi:hypothetical protein
MCAAGRRIFRFARSARIAQNVRRKITVVHNPIYCRTTRDGHEELRLRAPVRSSGALRVLAIQRPDAQMGLEVFTKNCFLKNIESPAAGKSRSCSKLWSAPGLPWLRGPREK